MDPTNSGLSFSTSTPRSQLYLSLSSHRYTISTSLPYPFLSFPPFSSFPFLSFLLLSFLFPILSSYFILFPPLFFLSPSLLMSLLFVFPFILLLFFSSISSLMFSLLLTHILYYHHHLRFISQSIPSIQIRFFLPCSSLVFMANIDRFQLLTWRARTQTLIPHPFRASKQVQTCPPVCRP